MKTIPVPARVLIVAVLSALVFALPARGDLVHRYSFSELSGTLVEDSAGDADGTIKGDGAFFDGAGQLYLPGGLGSAADPPAGYVDLPNGIISVLPSLTVETWVTWMGSQNWERVFDFGVSQGGEDIVNGEGGYLFMSPDNALNLRFASSDPVTFDEPDILIDGSMTAFQYQEVCLTVTYDPANNTSRVYTNGALAVAGTASIPLNEFNDVNNWLGRSQWNDPMFVGYYNEFRIYNSALNPLEVAASCISGPNQPSTDPALLGAIQAVNLTVVQLTMTEEDTQMARGTVDFANISGLPLAGIPGATITSDNEDVLTVDAAGLVTAVAAGTATLTLEYQGVADSETITVNPREFVIAIAGELFVDLQAADLSSDPTFWNNRAGTGGFIATGTPTYVADVEGTGVAGVQLNPVTPATDAYEGPVTTADLDGGSDRSIEVWAYNPQIAAEETLVALGRRGGPDGSNNSFNYGANGTYGAVGHWGAPDMGWNGPPAAGQWHYLVYTYDGVNTARVYADGLLKNTETFGAALDTHFGLPIRIGAQADQTGQAFDYGQALSGYLAMVRVHTGLLSGGDVAVNYLFGPTLTPPGALQTVTVAIDRPTIYGARAVGQAQVMADFENLKGLNVTGFSTLESTDPGVLTVNAAGVYTAVTEGTATIIATYRGMTASMSVTILPAPPLELKHRYSFSEAVGSSTAEDSVGAKHGEIKGVDAAFDGAGHLYLPGGVASATEPPAGYVDLPNYIISPLVNASIETWVTWQGSGIWERIFDFGTSDGGEDIVNGNGAYLFLSPAGSAVLRFAVRDPRTGTEPTGLNAPGPLTAGEEVYLAVSYNYTGNQAVLYSNAVQVASGPAAVPLNLINDVNNWLGRSQWNDTMFTGTYNEFRIWEGALSADQVAAAYAAGPDQLPEVAPPPTLTAGLSGGNLELQWPSTATGFGMESSTALGPQASWGAVDISGAVEQDGVMVLTIPIGGDTQFYRMKK